MTDTIRVTQNFFFSVISHSSHTPRLWVPSIGISLGISYPSRPITSASSEVLIIFFVLDWHYYLIIGLYMPGVPSSTAQSSFRFPRSRARDKDLRASSLFRRWTQATSVGQSFNPQRVAIQSPRDIWQYLKIFLVVMVFWREVLLLESTGLRSGMLLNLLQYTGQSLNSNSNHKNSNNNNNKVLASFKCQWCPHWETVQWRSKEGRQGREKPNKGTLSSKLSTVHNHSSVLLLQEIVQTTCLSVIPLKGHES